MNDERHRISERNKQDSRLPVDTARLRMGNSYSSAPEYHYDIEFTCGDCGKAERWSAAQKKCWYEEAGGYFFASAVRCRDCRAHERERRRKARIGAGHRSPARLDFSEGQIFRITRRLKTCIK